MTITTAITAYDEIRHHPGAPFTLGGRLQLLPSGYAIDRILTMKDGQHFVQCLDPVLEDGYVWGWVAIESVAIGVAA